EYAFALCGGLTGITIPASVVSVKESAFIGCSSLGHIDVNSANASYSGAGGVLLNKTGSFLVCYPGGKAGRYIVPSTVTQIGPFAFTGCKKLTSVLIPSNVGSIGDFAFNGCTGLLSVSIRPGVTAIGNNVFYGCTSLARVTLPSSVTSIGDYAFGNCTLLVSAVIPAQVTAIDPDAFYKCPGLTISGYAGSAAQVFAQQKSIPFILLSPARLSAKAGSTAFIDTENGFIVGLETGLNRALFESRYVTIAAGTVLTYTPPRPGFFGTQTRVQVKDTASGAALVSYYLVIYGDVNGDANVDSTDAGTLIDIENFLLSWNPASDAAFMAAADVNGDGNIDTMDAGVAIDYENWLVDIDQSTGLARPF
ncbi:MAG TPA: leucine-rich repeat protein, partial [Clostridiales bacterium]|nr:leucine-rich repeat protein [Clostridiales bacterium]